MQALQPQPVRQRRRVAASAEPLPPPLPRPSRYMRRFEASDFELVQQLGVLSFRTVATAKTTLSWSSDGETTPDALTVTRGASLADNAAAAAAAVAAGYASGAPPVAAVALYAARYTGGPGPPVPVLLKEHLAGAQALARRELAAFAALGTGPARRPGSDPPPPFALRLGEAVRAEPPVAPLLGFFEALPGSSESEPTVARLPREESLWVVERWEGIRPLADVPATPPPPPPRPNRGMFGWPIERVPPSDAALRARRGRFLLRCASRAVLALAHCHARLVAHGSLDGRALVLSVGAAEDDESSYEPAQDAFAAFQPAGAASLRGFAPAGGAWQPLVRLGSFGFAVTGAQSDDLAAAARADCHALGCTLGALLLDGGAVGGEQPRVAVTAEALRRLVVDIFSRDWAAVREYAAEEEGWEGGVALLCEAEGAGWALLEALLDDAACSADSERILAAAAAVEAAAADLPE